jgi:hypothetical protein
MKPNFEVTVLRFQVLREIQGAWSSADFCALLESVEFGDTSGMDEKEIREMALLALQDLEPVEAAKLLLAQHLGHRLNAGQIQNAASEMLDEKLWEEYADLSFHEAMFNVASILFAAFPRVFPEPDAVSATIEVSATNKAGRDILSGAINEPFLVRLLADGMDESSILNRLFEDQLRGLSFPEADNIVWIWSVDSSDASALKIHITSSGYWLDPLRDTKSYQSTAHIDAVVGND